MDFFSKFVGNEPSKQKFLNIGLILFIVVIIGIAVLFVYPQFDKNKQLRDDLENKLKQVQLQLEQTEMLHSNKNSPDDEINYDDLQSYVDPTNANGTHEPSAANEDLLLNEILKDD